MQTSRVALFSVLFVLVVFLAAGQALAAVTTLSIADSTAIEPSAKGTVNMVFTVTRTGPLDSQITVGYTTAAGTAQPGKDFTPQTGTITFAAGSATAKISIPIFGNGVYNAPSLSFSVKITGITDIAGPPVTLAAQGAFPTGTHPYSVAIGDLNGDGKPDVAVANVQSKTVSVFLNATAPGAATPSFAAKTDFPTGTSPESVAIGDLNGDGKPDLAVANFSDNTVSVLLNTTAPGAAIPSFAAQTAFPTGTSPQSVAIGDLNGDGKPDLAVANFTDSTVSVLLNTTATGATAPSFATQTVFSTGTNPYSVAIGDLNGDGKPDLAVANSAANTVSVLLNTTVPGAATPSFGPKHDFPTGSGPISVAIGDLNGDGKPDLAVANSNGNTVSVLRNTTAPGAVAPSFATQTVFPTGAGPVSVAIGDLNGDGLPDLVVANSTGNTVSVLRNTIASGASTPSFAQKTDFPTETGPASVAIGDFNGGRTGLAVANFSSATVSVLLQATAPAASFAAQTVFSTGPTPVSVAIGDFNGDGMPDLAIANQGDNSVSVLLNTTKPGAASPSFGPRTDFPAGDNPTSVAIGDLDGDGRPDLVVANSVDNTVSVLRNTTAPRAATPSFATKIDFYTGTAPQSVAIGDLNGDGKPDLAVANSLDNTVSVLVNTTAPGGDPSFATQAVFSTGSNPYSVAIGDLNGDGFPDLAVANHGDNTVSVLLNTLVAVTTTPSFAAQRVFSTGRSPYSVAIGDLNGDGMQDLAVANQADNTVSVLLNTAAPGAGAPSFAAKTDFSTGNSPTSVAIGDLNGDGKGDIAVANFNDNTVSVLLNTTAPNATAPSFAAKIALSSGSNPFSVAIGNLNGDGAFSLAVANSNSNTVSVLLNTTLATPSFTPQPVLAAGSNPYFMAIADLNGDGKPDLAVANFGDGTVSVFLNTTAPGAAAPSFAPPAAFPTGGGPAVVEIGDFNGDGKPDLAVANSANNTVSVLLNTTATGAAAPSFATQTVFPTGNAPYSLAVGDLNGDGKPDLAVGNYSDSTVSVLLNTTAPGATAATFAAQTVFPTGNTPETVAIGDLNGDGMADLAIANNAGTVSVLLNTTAPGAATPSFAAKTDFPAGSGAIYVAIADLNGDGKPDLAVANFNDNTVSVLLNTTAPGATAPAFAAQTVFPAGSGSDSVAIADLNGDGRPDLVIPNFKDNTVSVLMNSTVPGAATPSFARQIVIPTGTNPGVSIADLNGDGRPDLVVFNSADNTVSGLLNVAATVSRASASGTIVESDREPSVQFAAASETVAQSAGSFSIAVHLSAASALNTSVPFTLGGTATAGTDYALSTSSPLIIPAGQTTGTIAGKLSSAASAGGKTILVALETPTHATLGQTTINSLTISSSDAALSSLGLSSGTLSPAFSSATGSYTASVPNTVAVIEVTPTVQQANATVTVNGAAVASGKPSGAIALAVGANKITAAVTAQDGKTVRTYTVTVTRAPSSDALLSALASSSGTLSPAFSSSKGSYTASVPNTVAAIEITPTVQQANATVKVNGVAVASGKPSAAIALAVGANTIKIVATAQNGTTVADYEIVVTRAASSDAFLSDLVSSSGTLTPAFSSSKGAYTASVPNTVAAIEVTPTVQQANATVKVNGVAVASGKPSAAIALAVGSNTIKIVATAQNGSTTVNYQIVVTRAASSDAFLSNLSLSSGTLTPAFSSSKGAYTASVPNTVAAIEVTPTVQQVNATVKVNGAAVASGKPSAPIALAVGSNTVKIVVTAQNGTSTANYQVIVTRASAAPLAGREQRRLAPKTAASGGAPAEPRGVYAGVLQSDRAKPAFIGFLELTVAAPSVGAVGPSFTGVLHWGAERCIVRGSIDSEGGYGGKVPRPGGLAPLALIFKLAGPPPAPLAGTVREGDDGGILARFTARLSGWPPGAQPSRLAGRYALSLQPEPAETGALPAPGTGAGIVTIGAGGSLRFAGRMPDGTVVSQAATLSPDGIWPLYAPPQGTLGFLAGQARIDPSAIPVLSGSADWNASAAAASQRRLRLVGEKSPDPAP